MSAILEVNPKKKREKYILTGEAANPLNPPPTCRFASRCPEVCDICRTAPLPPLTEIGVEHMTNCHIALSGCRKEKQV